MKAKYLTIIAASILLSLGCTSCIDTIKQKAREVKEKIFGNEKKDAAETTWDFYILGSWKYTQSDTDSDYAEGVESFLGTGEYFNHTETVDGKRVVMQGTWVLDDEEDFTLNVTVTTIKTAKGTENVNIKKKYIIYSLEPGVQLNYTADGSFRQAAHIIENQD